MILFSPPRSFEATELEEGEGDHRHERMAVKSLPGSPFEVVEPKLLFQLLMGMLANPTCLDGGSQSAQIGRSRQIGEICPTMQKVPVYGAFCGWVAACLPFYLPKIGFAEIRAFAVLTS